MIEVPQRMTAQLTPKQTESAIRIIRSLVDIGECCFWADRAWVKGKTCREENGRGYDCPHCEASAFISAIDKDTA